MNDFIHLHLHSEYSLLDGAVRISKLPKKLKELGQTAAAITDHGNMFGVIDFYKAMKAEGLKPIIGCEVYVAPGSRFEKSKTTDTKAYNHLVLLAKNNEGYKNLCKIVSLGYTEGFYYHPRVDKEVISEYHDGLVCLSACIAGSIPTAILKDNMVKAQEEVEFFKNTFGEDFYIEIQRHGIPEEDKANPVLIELAKKYGIKVVATNDCHYIEREDAEVQDVMLCIQTGATISEEKRMRFATQEFFVKSTDEMAELFRDIPESITNTQEIADKCNVEFEFGKIKLPYYEIPEGFENHFEYLKHLSTVGMKKRYGENCPQEYWDRMNYELDTINSMGFVGYFLIVWDFINWAKEHDIPVGPGRGSGAGSIVAYAIGITDLEPMRYNLLFERFLNPERVSMPDFDVDFCYERRGEVIDYVTQKYGQERVSQIITFGTLASKQAVLDVGKVLEVPDAEVKKISSLIPGGTSLSDAIKLPEMVEAYKNPNVKKIIDIAIKLEGMPRHISSHAAGVLIADKAITEYAPLAVTNKGNVIIQFPMTTLEEIGLVKMDFLGLRTLTVIKKAEMAVRKHNPDFNIAGLSLDDPETYTMLASGKTDAVFQFESTGMKSVLKQLKPSTFEDLIAIISLYRPGPMDSIPEYIENKHNPDAIKYADPRLKEILGVTYGVLVYQEQVMQLFRSLAGFSLGRADIVRRGMAKKKIKIIEEEKKHFLYGLKDEDGNTVIEGAIARGVDEKVGHDLMDTMTAFASYAFNKSHAAAYAKVSYQTAYLLCHYPKEYIAAYISSMDEANKFKKACNVCRNNIGIPIVRPDINLGESDFSVDGDGVRFGLANLANVNADFIAKAISEREANGEYKSLSDFVIRTYCKNLNARVMDSLIGSGALDFTGEPRAQMLENYPAILESAKKVAFAFNNKYQHTIFEMLGSSDINSMFGPELTTCEEMTMDELLEGEINSAKLYFSGNPFGNYMDAINELGFHTIDEIVEIAETDPKNIPNEVVLPVKIYSTKRKMSKKMVPYMTMVIEDITIPVEATAYQKCMTKYGDMLVDNKICIVKCFVKLNDSDGVDFSVSSVYPLPQNGVADYDDQIKNLRKSLGKYFTRKTLHSVATDVSKISKVAVSVGVIVEDYKSPILNKIGEIVRKYPGECRLYALNIANKSKHVSPTTVNYCPELVKELDSIGIKTVTF